MAAKKSVPTAAEVAAAFRLIADAIDAGVFTSGGSTSDAATDKYDREEIEGLPIGDLRTLAKDLGLDEQKVKKSILDEMEAKGLFTDSEDEEDEEEFEDEDEADEDDDEDAEDEDEEDDEEEDEDEEDEESEGYDREELEGMSLVELKKLAKEEGHAASVYRKMDQDALIDLLAGDDDEDAEDDEEEEEIDEDTLKAMDLGQLKKVAAELELKVPVAVAKNKTKLVNFILENAGEEDDE